MSPSVRDILPGAAGALVLLLALTAFGMPLWLGLVLGGAVYAGLHLMLAPAPAAASGAAAPSALGLTPRERDEFLAACRRSCGELGALAGRISPREFSARVRELAAVAENLTACFACKPAAILLAPAVPRNLERLVAMLQQYVELSQLRGAGDTAAAALRQVEAIVGAARDSFAGMYEQLLAEDAAALDASAGTLGILLGAEERTGGAARGAPVPGEVVAGRRAAGRVGVPGQSGKEL